jgi:hypothetical protein
VGKRRETMRERKRTELALVVTLAKVCGPRGNEISMERGWKEGGKRVEEEEEMKLSNGKRERARGRRRDTPSSSLPQRLSTLTMCVA